MTAEFDPLDAEAIEEVPPACHGYKKGIEAALYLLEDAKLGGNDARSFYVYMKAHLDLALRGGVTPGPCEACEEIRKQPLMDAADRAGMKAQSTEASWEGLDLVLGFFKGDTDRTHLWFDSPNPLLGGIRPREMLALGRSEKLLQFIKNRLADNAHPGGL